MSNGGSGSGGGGNHRSNVTRRRSGWSRGGVRRLGVGRGWISGRGGLRVDFDGNLYVLDSQEEGAGWDANYIPESETQEADIIGPYVADSEDVRVQDYGFFVPETQDPNGPAGLVGGEDVDVVLDDGEDGAADFHGGEDNVVSVEEMASCVQVKDQDAAMVDLHDGIDLSSGVVIEALMSVEPLVEALGVQVEDGPMGLAGREDGSSGMDEEVFTGEVVDQAVFMEAVPVKAAVDDLHAGVQEVYDAVEDIYRPVFLDMMKIMLPEYIQLIGAQDDDDDA